jgi:hypothetical protein
MTYSTETGVDLDKGSYAGVPERTGWTGWIIFAGTMMLLLGSFHAIQGFLALLDDGYYLVASDKLAVHVDFTTWGWVHLILGSVVALAGVSLFAGRMWARIVAVLAAMVSALVNIAFLAAFPVWSTIMIGLDVIVIWAVTVHGREMELPS